MLRSHFRFKKNKKKGFSMPLSILVTMIIAAIFVFILIFVVYHIVTSSSDDTLNTEKNVYDQIKSSLPFLSGFLIFPIFRNRKRGSFALKTLFYLLLGIFIATILVLTVIKIKDKGENPGVNINNPSIKLKCSQECALNSNYESCFDNCIKSATKNKNINIGGEERNEQQTQQTQN